MANIGKILFKDHGAFDVDPRVGWVQDGQKVNDQGSWGRMSGGDPDKTMDPGDAGCPENAPVWAYASVVWGDDASGSPDDGCVYVKGDPHLGIYRVTGTARAVTMHFDGIEPTSAG